MLSIVRRNGDKILGMRTGQIRLCWRIFALLLIAAMFAYALRYGRAGDLPRAVFGVIGMLDGVVILALAQWRQRVSERA